jgi:hypothetical protein
MVDALRVGRRGGGTPQCEVPFEEVTVKRGGMEVRRRVCGELGSFFYC